MKVLVVNTRDIIGGAAIASNRIHKGLIELGIDSKMLVDIKKSKDETVLASSGFPSYKIRSRLDHLPLRLFTLESRSISFIKGSILKRIEELDPDIVHLNWINNGFISIEQLAKIKRPTVWTMHDMWSFSDARHYVDESESPSFKSKHPLDGWVWRRKKKAYAKINDLHLVTPSKWLADLARESELLKERPITVIGNGIDTNFYKPGNKIDLRKKLGIEPSDINILFSGYNAVADDRKGFRYLAKAIELIEKNKEFNITYSVLGSESSNIEETNKVKTRYFGSVQDQELIRDIYAASDLFILPSLQDNLPNTVLEAMSCGCPTIAFNIGGIPDMVDHKINGFLAKSRDSEDLANGILWYLEKSNKSEIEKSARLKVTQHFEILKQTQRYIDLYKSILAS